MLAEGGGGGGKKQKCLYGLHKAMNDSTLKVLDVEKHFWVTTKENDTFSLLFVIT